MHVKGEGAEGCRQFFSATADITAGRLQPGEDDLRRYTYAGVCDALTIYRNGASQYKSTRLRPIWSEPALPDKNVETLSFRHV